MLLARRGSMRTKIVASHQIRAGAAALAALALVALGASLVARRVRAPELSLIGANVKAKLPPITPPAMPVVRNPIDDAITTSSALPAKLPIGAIEFPLASATPTAESMPAIDALAASLKEHDGARVRLDGYTDAVGEDADNRSLSWRRAEAVKTLLQDRGIGAERMMSVGHSGKRPIGDNATAPGRAENRRVEALLVAR